MSKERLDKEILRRGLADTRQKAQGLILSGKVLVDGRVADKAGTQVGPDADIRLAGEPIPYVSRGGLKLKGALDKFNIDASGLVCADIGASTGGFTDCLLQEGAARVYAIDVGYGILDLKVRGDSRVTVIERFNARFLTHETLPEKVDLAVIDASFISLKLLLKPVMAILKPESSIIALVKPQFEVGRENVGKGGIVRDEGIRAASLEAIKEFARSLGMQLADEMESPIRGAKGNVEYLIYLRTA